MGIEDWHGSISTPIPLVAYAYETVMTMDEGIEAVLVILKKPTGGFWIRVLQ